MSVYRQRAWRVATLLLIAALALAGTPQSAAAPLVQESTAFETMLLPAEALSWGVDPSDRARATPSAKLDSSLAGLAAAGKVSAQAAQAWAESQALRLSQGRVHVQVVTDATGWQGAVAAMTRSGGEVTKASSDKTLIQGWLPVAALEAVATDEDIYLIRRPAELVLSENGEAGNATTEGLAVINGPAWHTAGHWGAGVKIGIIDGGFLGYRSLLGVDLPAAVTVKNFVDGETDPQVDGTTKHGTACAEIVHDIAPAATFFLAKISTSLDLQEAVAWLRDTHQVDIISTSMVWYNETPGDGTGEFADMVQEARDAGILWVTAAANDREAHWGGRYFDPDNTGFHYFNAGQNVNFFGPGDNTAYGIPAGYRITVFLRWNDWSTVDQDYDLYLLRWDGSTWSIVARGEDLQNGSPGQKPVEYATAVTSGSTTAYGFVIRRHSSDQAVNFEVFAPKLARLDEVLHARSLSNLADAPGALTVAALDVIAPYPQEPYSSQGPTNGPGGAQAGGFIKPDLAGFAKVSTVSYGVTNRFDGTSAAVPHVTGAAALVKGAFPAFTPAQVQGFLEERAVDMGPAGMDSAYGHGRLALGVPPVALRRYLPIILKQGPTGAATSTPAFTPSSNTQPASTPMPVVQPGG